MGLWRAAGSVLRFTRYVFRNFFNDGCLQSAGELSYTTLLAVVPLTAVVFGVLSAFPVFQDLGEEIQDFIFANFLPASGEVIRQHLLEFAEKAKGLTLVGVIFLVVTALLLVSGISRTLNGIWRVRIHRSLMARFLVYWAILTLGPLLVGVSLAISSYLISLPLLSDQYVPGLRRRFFLLAPWASAMLAFFLMYIIVPERRVGVLHALAGGAIAAFLFELAKRGFALYITSIPTYQTIYGALAAIPIFLIWIYVCWIVILLGAVFTYCLESPESRRSPTTPHELDLVLAYRLIARLWEAQETGQALSTRRLLSEVNVENPNAARILLHELAMVRVVLRTEDRKWIVARDLNVFTLLDLYRCRPFLLPDYEHVDVRHARDRAVRNLLTSSSAQLYEGMRVPLAELFCKPDSATLSGGAQLRGHREAG